MSAIKKGVTGACKFNAAGHPPCLRNNLSITAGSAASSEAYETISSSLRFLIID